MFGAGWQSFNNQRRTQRGLQFSGGLFALRSNSANRAGLLSATSVRATSVNCSFSKSASCAGSRSG